MVHHVRQGVGQNRQGFIVTTPKIRNQNLDLCLGRQGADLADAIHIMLRTAITQVVAVNAGNYDVFQVQCGNRLRQLCGFFGTQRVGATVTHIAERATARAFIAHYHESSRAFAETFADVGAARFFAHRYQFVGTENIFDFVKPRAGGAGFDANPVGLFQRLTLFDLDGNARNFGGGFLFEGGIVHGAMKGVENRGRKSGSQISKEFLGEDISRFSPTDGNTQARQVNGTQTGVTTRIDARVGF